MARRWLFKTEPTEYSFADLERDQKAVWDGVSNSLALKNLREVRLGDDVIIYHTGEEKAIVGLAVAISDAYPDPKDHSGKLTVVDLKPKRRSPRVVTLADVKARPELQDFELARLPRLSVMPVNNEQWQLIREMSGL
jgi:predicted RNA-binding protein with PUA-like domain